MIDWKAAAIRAVNRMTVEEAQSWLNAYAQEPISISRETVRSITGGYSSQSLNQAVKLMVYTRSKGGKVSRRNQGL